MAQNKKKKSFLAYFYNCRTKLFLSLVFLILLGTVLYSVMYYLQDYGVKKVAALPFADKVSYSSEDAKSVVYGDFNNDSKMDLATSNYNPYISASRKIRIFTGNGSGDFTNTYTLSVGDNAPYVRYSPYSIISADVDKDGKLDLITTNYAPYVLGGYNVYKGITVYPNNGDGTFSISNGYSAGNETLDIQQGDFNGDTYPDLAVTIENESKIGIFINKGNGQFNPISKISVASTASRLAIADIDNDTDLDIVAALNGELAIILGNGNGTFQSPTTKLSENSSTAVALADFNGDSNLDIASVGNKLLIHIGYGDGTFSSGFSEEVLGRNLTITDLNNDSVSDLVLVQNQAIVYMGVGDGTFVSGGLYDIGVTRYENANNIISYDFNGDTLNDLASCAGDNMVVLNNLDHPFIVSFSPVAVFVGEPTFTLNVHGSGFNVNSVIKFNGVNKTTNYIDSNNLTTSISNTDVAYVNVYDISVVNDTQESLTRMFYVEPGFFDAKNNNSGNQPKASYSADFNGDDVIDVAVANFADNNISILLGQGDGIFNPATPETVAVGSQPNSIIGGDFNGDQNIDLAVVNSGNNNMTILLGNGQGGFTSAGIISTGSGPNKVIADYFDGDQNFDLAVVNSGSDNINILLGNGGGVFSQSDLVSAGDQPKSVISADINDDSINDLLTANSGDNTISIFIGNGDGTFSPGSPATISVTQQPTDLTKADFNGDNITDLAVVNFLSNDVYIFIGNGDGTFTPASTPSFNVDTAPIAVISHDFNDDDKDDLIVSNSGSDNVFVFLGNGDGTFYSSVSYNTGDQPYHIIKNDFNNDDLTDFLTTNNIGNNISVFLRKNIVDLEDIRYFEDPITYSVSQDPGGITSGDVNGDNKPDILVGDQTDDNITVFLNNGEGSFSLATNSPFIFGDYPLGLSIADFNGDSNNDLVVGYPYGQYIRLALGNGDGTFSLNTSFTFGMYPKAVISDDFNNDNDNDFIITNGSAGVDYVTVVLGDGSGGFSLLNNYTVGSWPLKITKGDFNNDNIIDIATTHADSNIISVLLGNGDGSFGSDNNFTAGENALLIKSIDVNNDNNLDLIAVRSAGVGGGGDPFMCDIILHCYDPIPPDPAACEEYGCFPLSGNGIYVLLGNGTGSFSAASSYGDLINGEVLGVDNLNGDNYVDIVAARYDTVAELVVLINNGSGGFSELTSYTLTSTPRDIVIADFDTDTKNDLAVINGQVVMVYLGNGAGSFTQTETISLGYTPAKIISADLDQDSIVDLIVGSGSEEKVTVLFGNGNGTFQVPVDYVGQYYLNDLVINDFDNDNSPDILYIADQTANNISLFLNNGDGTFPTAYRYDMGRVIQSFLVEDFNQDSYYDLFAGLTGGDTFKVFLGQANLGFSDPVEYQSGSCPSYAASEDFNEDGNLDMVVSNMFTNYVNVFFGVGDGSFQTPPDTYTVGDSPRTVLAADLNQDDILDITVANAYSANLSILLGNGDGTFADAIFSNVYVGASGQKIADFNGDGRQDLVVRNVPNSIALMFGNGDGTFQSPLIYQIGFDPGAITLNDFNNDQKTDLAIVDNAGEQIAVLFGTRAATVIYRPFGITYPAPPYNLVCQALSNNKIRWFFEDQAYNETGFRLYGPEGLLVDSGENIVTDLSYLDESDLEVNSLYADRTVRTFASSGESDDSNMESCFTLANEPLPAIVEQTSEGVYRIVIDVDDGNPEWTEYAIYEYYSDQYVQTGDFWGDEAVWQTRSEWGGDSGVNVSIEQSPVEFLIIAKNGDGIIAGFQSGKLNINCDVKSSTEIDWHLRTPADWPKLGFKIYQSEEAGNILIKEYEDAVNTDKLHQEAGLIPNSKYSRFFTTYEMVEGVYTESEPSDIVDCYTLANLPLPVIIGEVTEDSVQIIIDAGDGNPGETEYSIYEANSGLYVQTDGSLGSEPVWQTRSQWGGETGIYVNVVDIIPELKVIAQFFISINVEDYNFVAQVRNSAGVVTEKPESNISAIKYVGRNITNETDFDNNEEEVLISDELTYKIAYINSGEGVAQDVVINDILNPNLDYITDSAIINKGGIETTAGINLNRSMLSFNLGNILAGETGYVLFKAKIKSEYTDPNISNSATIIDADLNRILTNKTINTISPELLVDFIEQEDMFAEGAEVGVTEQGRVANNPPQAVDDAVETSQAEPIEIMILANDTDAEENIDSSSLTIVTEPSNGVVSIALETGTITYTPNEDYTGTDTFSYKVCDLENACDQAIVSVTINPGVSAGLIKEEGAEVKISIVGSLLKAVTSEISDTRPAQGVLKSIVEQNKTVKAIVESAPVKMAREKVLNNPAVETVSQDVVTPALVTVAVVNTVPTVATVTVNIWSYLHFLFIEPLLLLFRRKRKKWGIVYDSLSKTPLSLATVRLYSKKDKRLIQTKVTDKDGRYLLIVKEPGKYYLEIAKPGYEFPSKILRDEKQDTKFVDLYHGQEIEVKEKGGVITANIPMDTVADQIKPVKEVIKNYTIKNLRLITSYVGLILAVLVLIIYPSVITLLALIIHIAFYGTFRKILVPKKPKSWGIVYDKKTKAPLNLAVVRIFDMKFNKLLETQVTDAKGRYAFLASKNLYQLSAEKQGYQKEEIQDIDLVKKEDIVNLDIGLNKSK